MFLIANNIGFRQIDESDLEQLRDWRNSPDIRSRTRNFAPLTLLNQQNWWSALPNSDNMMFGIYQIDNFDKRLIGVCGLCHIDWKNRNAELSYYIGDAKHRGKGYGRETSYLLFEYGFRELGLHRVWGEIYSCATEIIEIDAKLGFKTDGVIRDTYWHDGQWWDSHIVSILDHEWDAIRGDYLVKAAPIIR